MTNLPFTILKHLHTNYSSFYSNNDNKYEIIDTNRVPYIAKYNKEILNFLSVADENGSIKLFRTYPKLILTKEIPAQKSCIYDLEWLTSNQLACGGGDQFVSVYDIHTSQRLAVLRGHTESVKSLSSIPRNPYVIASGSRDGSVLIFDIRCNKYQPTAEIITELNIDREVSCIRAINVFNKAHFTETIINNSHRSILKSKVNNISSPLSPSINQNLQSANRKSSPVACILYQNEHFLISAGVTDGLIKVWDTRKIHTCSSKKLNEPTPVYVFDYQTDSASKKGFSNLTFNSNRTHLYSNCMNNHLYESNMLTYDSSHVRVVNQALRPKVHKNFHLNNSNFIKSSLSQCGNFIVTGSSDFNAYIYSTNQNSNLSCFKRYMPVIALKGHTNEVTTVDWNPFDPNQLVTCSDDNSIRLWNVKRDLEELESKECNFLKSEIIDEFKPVEENGTENDLGENSDYILPNERDENYISGIIFNKKMYNKFRPHSTGVFDDRLFVAFEHKKFLRKPKSIVNKINFEDMDFENELCLKCENINIDKVSTNYEASPTSSMLNSIENDLVEVKNKSLNGFKKLKSILSDLPINYIDEIECDNSEKVDVKPDSKINLSTVFSALCKSQSVVKPKTIKRKNIKTRKSQDSPEGLTQSNILMNLNRTPLTSKKRNINATIKDESLEPEHLKTPKTKKRLIMSECQTPTQPELNSQTRATVLNNVGTKTILDYFTTRQQGSQ